MYHIGTQAHTKSKSTVSLYLIHRGTQSLEDNLSLQEERVVEKTDSLGCKTSSNSGLLLAARRTI
jgi:hypothetical protein